MVILLGVGRSLPPQPKTPRFSGSKMERYLLAAERQVHLCLHMAQAQVNPLIHSLPAARLYGICRCMDFPVLF
jgi:hypothetical protein